MANEVTFTPPEVGKQPAEETSFDWHAPPLGNCLIEDAPSGRPGNLPQPAATPPAYSLQKGHS
jgi:hypothetical protein